MARLWPALIVAAAITSSGCGRGDGSESGVAKSADAGPEPSQGVVDSIFPMEVMLARFREGLTEPSALTHGEPSRDALVDRIVAALEANDTLAFESVAVDMSEFAWLYFPTALIAKPPYELPPALAWFRLQEGNRKGVFRALREFGGRPLELQGYQCGAEAQLEGENRIWTGCALTLVRAGEAVSVRLFESILERDGRFAVLSYANDFSRPALRISARPRPRSS